MQNKTIKINNIEYTTRSESVLHSCVGCCFQNQRSDCLAVKRYINEGCNDIIWEKAKPKVEGHPHAKLMMEYAQDCLTDSRAYEKWEFSHHSGVSSVVWMPLNDHPEWEPGCVYQRKLPVIMIDGSEVPKPVLQPLTHGDEYWVALPAHADHLTWYGDRFDLAFLNAGLVHLSKEAAEKHIEVLYAYNKKCCNA